MTTIDIVPGPKDLTNRVLQKKYLGIENDILKQQRVRNKNDQNLFYVGVNMVVMADKKEELESITETLRNMGNGRMCQIEPHYYQQLEALNTVLPVEKRRLLRYRKS